MSTDFKVVRLAKAVQEALSYSPERVRKETLSAWKEVFPGTEPKKLPRAHAELATLVMSAAKASKTGRFGRDKVFINHVAKQLADMGYEVDPEQFKSALVIMHRESLLSLCRADLVAAMPENDVRESDTHYRGATFNFVNLR